jgi:hypothetical protein
MLRFKGTRIWPFNPKAMDSKIGPSTIYTLQNLVKEEKESEQEDGEQEWTEHIAAEEFVDISSKK